MNRTESRIVEVNLSENMLIEESLQSSEKIISQIHCFSLNEVANHGDASDCWIIIYDRVYRITDFLDKVRHLSDLTIVSRVSTFYYKMLF